MRVVMWTSYAVAIRPARHLIALGISFALTACLDENQPIDPLSSANDRNPVYALNVGSALVLRGTVIAPDGVIKHGYVGIINGRIVSVSEKQPDIPGATTVNTEGIIAPGFVDIHNHLIWNVLPRWNPSRTFSNQEEWNSSTEARQILSAVENIVGSRLCDLNAWGELRALVGGTTSTIGARQEACIHGLVRNLDYNSGFYGTTELNRERIYNNVLFPPPSDAAGRAQLVGFASFLIANPAYEGLVIHAAEGVDAFAEEQFTFLQSNNLLNPKGVIVHGISLTQSDFQAMAAKGTALVWSPRSNLELYGTTTNINAALDAAVEIAIGPDWALTGSSNMLDELKVASRWNREHLGGRLTDRNLVDMVTSVAARIVGIDDEVGAIRPGLRADLVVISGEPSNPLRAIVNAGPGDVQLVMIGGVPLYGARDLLQRFWISSDLEEIGLPGGPKTLATPAAGILVSQIASRLNAALISEGTTLATLTDQDGGNTP